MIVDVQGVMREEGLRRGWAGDVECVGKGEVIATGLELCESRWALGGGFLNTVIPCECQERLGRTS